MKKILLGISVALMLVLVACQSAESKEILDYHNGYIENVDSKLEKVDEYTNELYNGDPTDEKAVEMADELETIGVEAMEYMEKQEPAKEETKEYHALRLEFISLLKESIDLDVKMIRGILDDSIDEDGVAALMEESFEKYDQAVEKQEEAEDKIDELSKKYEFQEIKD